MRQQSAFMQTKVGAENCAQFMRIRDGDRQGGPRGRANFRLRQPSGCKMVVITYCRPQILGAINFGNSTEFQSRKHGVGNRILQTMRFGLCRQEFLDKKPTLFTGKVPDCRESSASEPGRQFESFHTPGPLLPPSHTRTTKTWAPTSRKKIQFGASILSLWRETDSVYSQIGINEKVYACEIERGAANAVQEKTCRAPPPAFARCPSDTSGWSAGCCRSLWHCQGNKSHGRLVMASRQSRSDIASDQRRWSDRVISLQDQD